MNYRAANDLIPVAPTHKMNIGHRGINLKERAWSEGFLSRTASNFPVTQIHTPFAISRCKCLTQSASSIFLIVILELAKRKDFIGGRHDRNPYPINGNGVIPFIAKSHQRLQIRPPIRRFPSVFVKLDATVDNGLPELIININSDRAILSFYTQTRPSQFLFSGFASHSFAPTAPITGKLCINCLPT